MQRKRDELVPVAEAWAGQTGPVSALQPAALARRGFTQADQVNQVGGGQRSGPRSGFHGAAYGDKEPGVGECTRGSHGDALDDVAGDPLLSPVVDLGGFGVGVSGQPRRHLP